MPIAGPVTGKGDKIPSRPVSLSKDLEMGVTSLRHLGYLEEAWPSEQNWGPVGAITDPC